MGNLRAGQGSTGAKGGLESSLKRMPNDLQGLGRPAHGNLAVPHWQLLKHKSPHFLAAVLPRLRRRQVVVACGLAGSLCRRSVLLRPGFFRHIL